MGRRKDITVEDRKHWTLSAVRREGSIVSLSREAGVSEQTLHRWIGLFIEGGNERLSRDRSTEQMEIDRLKKELNKRDRVIREQSIAIRVLKKILGGRLKLNDELRAEVNGELSQTEGENRLIGVLHYLGISPSTWYR